MYSFFHNGVNLLFEMHCPLKTMSRKELKKKKNPWIDTKILDKMHEKELLHSELLQTGDLEISQMYESLRNKINHLIRKKKFLYQKGRLSKFKTNIKKLWKEINTITGRSKTNNIPSSMFYHNKKISSSREISEKFNSHYSKVAENLIKKMRPAQDPLTHLNSIDKTFYSNLPVTYHLDHI